MIGPTEWRKNGLDLHQIWAHRNIGHLFRKLLELVFSSLFLKLPFKSELYIYLDLHQIWAHKNIGHLCIAKLISNCSTVLFFFKARSTVLLGGAQQEPRTAA